MTDGRVLSEEEIQRFHIRVLSGMWQYDEAELINAVSTIRDLQQQVSELTELLEICQWSDDHYCTGYCKVCGNAEEDGHKADCRVNEALAKHAPRQEDET